ncbi:unnamed protein product [Hermetia illucens]|uniref:Anaphase-promoting complex subunit 11 RING-H2 finger domain-containing protein n=1 Tax=Hermetia illucens TaxID=343691 RepID=A0A7R8YQC9_HERIL|nr:unnamed protein product [Hermetia illucens]
MADDNDCGNDKYESDSGKPEKMFTLKKWNAVAMWSWDVECDICAICRVQVMDDSEMGLGCILIRLLGPLGSGLD